MGLRFGGKWLRREKEGGSIREGGSVERLSNALCKMSGSWKKHEGRRKGRIKVQNASLSLASTLFLPTKLFSCGKWVKRH